MNLKISGCNRLHEFANLTDSKKETKDKIKQNKTFWREQSVSIKKDAISTSGLTQFCVDGRSSFKMKNKERKKEINKK